MKRGAHRTLVLATRGDLCPVCKGRGVVACEVLEPAGDWPWPRFIDCCHCKWPWLPYQTFHKRSA